MPSNILDVIVFPEPAKPARRSLLTVGANERETSFEPAKDLAASAIVRPRNSAVVETPGCDGCQLNSLTASR